MYNLCIAINNAFCLPDIYYGGEAVSAEQPQSFACPYCGKMGFTEVTLQEHVTTEHTDSSAEVVSIKHLDCCDNRS